MHMVKRHLKRMNSPKTWPITRKETVFVMRPQTGAHSLLTAMPLSILLKDVLALAATTREIKYLLQNQEVLVNGDRILRLDYNVGLMDVVSFPALKTSFRILINKRNTLVAQPIAGSEATLVPRKIVRKTVQPGKKLQLAFHDGTTALTDKTYKVGDTVVSTFEGAVKEHLALDKGAFVLVTNGKHVGFAGTIEKLEGKKAFLHHGDEHVETVTSHVFVLGHGKPVIKLSEKVNE